MILWVLYQFLEGFTTIIVLNHSFFSRKYNNVNVNFQVWIADLGIHGSQWQSRKLFIFVILTEKWFDFHNYLIAPI